MQTSHMLGLGDKASLAVARKIRSVVDKAVIPYPTNQKCGVEGLLRMDKKFRTHGPENQKREYHKRPHIEAVYSFLKTQLQHDHQQSQR